MFNKKGQAAVEYLVTYGWAFIAILATVGVMSYFGLLNPSKYIPDTCEFGEQLQCQDHIILDDKNITIRFENNFEETINITNAYGPDGINSNMLPITLKRGEIKKIKLITSRELYSGEKESFEIIIMFHRDALNAPDHNITGKVFGEVQSNELGLIT